MLRLTAVIKVLVVLHRESFHIARTVPIARRHHREGAMGGGSGVFECHIVVHGGKEKAVKKSHASIAASDMQHSV